MRFESPATVSEALELLAMPGARCLAGGQSLGPMMNADLLEPDPLVSLARIPELRRIEPLPGGGTRLGAAVTYAEVGRLAPAGANLDLLVRAIPLIAHPAIRNQGTVGGSVCHADPAGDFPTLITCVDATLRIAGTEGVREVAAREFFAGYFETALQPGELLLAIDVPPAAPDARAHYEKFMITEGDFAVASIAAIVGWRDGICTSCSLAVGACAPAPVRVAQAEQALVGSRLDEAALARAGALLAQACDPIDDFRASRGYRLKLVPRLLRRAVQQAQTRGERA